MQGLSNGGGGGGIGDRPGLTTVSFNQRDESKQQLGARADILFVSVMGLVYIQYVLVVCTVCIKIHTVYCTYVF